MIKKIRHKGLKRLFKDDDRSELNQAHIEILRRMLSRLDVSERPNDMDLPGWGLHPMKGNLKGFWAVWVNKNWRLIWRFDGSDATDVDYLDYHKK